MAACLHKARNYVTESTATDQICKNGPESGKLNVGRRRPGIQSLADMSIHHISSIL